MDTGRGLSGHSAVKASAVRTPADGAAGSPTPVRPIDTGLRWGRPTPRMRRTITRGRRRPRGSDPALSPPSWPLTPLPPSVTTPPWRAQRQVARAVPPTRSRPTASSQRFGHSRPDTRRAVGATVAAVGVRLTCDVFAGVPLRMSQRGEVSGRGPRHAYRAPGRRRTRRRPDAGPGASPPAGRVTFFAPSSASRASQRPTSAYSDRSDSAAAVTVASSTPR